jgi:hypothetical protein
MLAALNNSHTPNCFLLLLARPQQESPHRGGRLGAGSELPSSFPSGGALDDVKIEKNTGGLWAWDPASLVLFFFLL